MRESIGHVPGPHFPYCTRASELVFAGTHTPHDLGSGRLVRGRIDLPEELARASRLDVLFPDVVADRPRAQTLRVLDNLRRSLEAMGSSLSRLCHLRVFVRDLTHVAHVFRTMAAVLGEQSTSGGVIEARNEGSDPEIDVFVDAVALTDDCDWPIQPLQLTGIDQLTAPFAPAVRAGPLLFTSGLAGIDARTKLPVDSPAELDAGARRLVERFGTTEPRVERMLSQQATAWRHVCAVLAAAGLSHRDVHYHMAWMGEPMALLAHGSLTRAVVDDVGDWLVTCFPASGLRYPGSVWDVRVVATDPRGDWTVTSRGPRHGVSNSYHAAMRVGPFVFSSGEVPIDTEARRCIERSNDLDDSWRTADTGRAHRHLPILAQTHFAYSRLEAALAVHDASLRDVVHQSVYLTDAMDFPAFESVARTRLGQRLPATTMVPILGASPFPQTRLELEVTAWAPQGNGQDD